MAISFRRPAMKLLDETTLTGTGASIDFDEVEETWYQFRMIGAYNSTDAGAENVYMQFNGDTGANYIYSRYYAHSVGIGGDQSAGGITGILVGGCGGSWDATRWARSVFDLIGNQNGKDKMVQHVTARSDNNAGGNFGLMGMGFWNNTATLTDIHMWVGAGVFSIGSTFKLYGIGPGKNA